VFSTIFRSPTFTKWFRQNNKGRLHRLQFGKEGSFRVWKVAISLSRTRGNLAARRLFFEIACSRPNAIHLDLALRLRFRITKEKEGFALCRKGRKRNLFSVRIRADVSGFFRTWHLLELGKGQQLDWSIQSFEVLNCTSFILSKMRTIDLLQLTTKKG